jgi:hypothetical protein
MFGGEFSSITFKDSGFYDLCWLVFSAARCGLFLHNMSVQQVAEGVCKIIRANGLLAENLSSTTSLERRLGEQASREGATT